MKTDVKWNERRNRFQGFLSVWFLWNCVKLRGNVSQNNIIAQWLNIDEGDYHIFNHKEKVKSIINVDEKDNNNDAEEEGHVWIYIIRSNRLYGQYHYAYIESYLGPEVLVYSEKIR